MCQLADDGDIHGDRRSASMPMCQLADDGDIGGGKGWAPCPRVSDERCSCSIQCEGCFMIRGYLNRHAGTCKSCAPHKF